MTHTTDDIRPLDEAFDTMMEVERNPNGAWNAIQTLAAQAAAANARADRAEAALAAQIEADAGIADAGIADDYTPEKHSGMTLQAHVTGRNIASAIRNQPHDRSALDRLLADAEAKASANALRRVVELPHRIESLGGQNYAYVRVEEILALIPKEGKQ